ncbi:MAG: protein kinase domain-containing protein [Acidimicrobiales bacterium]
MAADETPPTLVASRYRLERSLGAGGSGRVWQGTDTVLERSVAVKTVELPAHVEDAERRALRSRVLREARAAARIDHPGTVRMYDVVDEGDRVYLVMELVRARTLGDVVDHDGPLSPRVAAGMGLELLGALTAAHRAGIVHRDVKPRNVMVLDDGSVKLADFGIATVKDDARITATGIVLGTPSYMAPEQARGHGPGPSADLWGLGALLYFAVEGVGPFERGGEILPTLNAVLHDPPGPMERAGPLATVVTALLAKAPGDRPSAGEAQGMLADIARDDEEPGALGAGAGPDRTAVLAPPPPAGGRDGRPPPSAPSADRPALVRRPLPRPPTGWLVALAVAGAVAVVAVLAAVALPDRGGEDPAAGTSPTTTVEPTTTTAGEAPTTASTAPSTTASPDRPDGVPADWVPYVDQATGYRLWHPPSWAPRPAAGNAVDFGDPASGDYLRVDYVRPPGDDPEGAWEAQSESFARRYGDYREIRIEETEFMGFDAAIWEYTYSGQHATNLGFVTDDYGFALNLQTAEARWDQSQDLSRAFEAGFRPPG